MREVKKHQYSLLVTWTGNDGTFSSAPRIALPLRQTVELPVEVHPATPGAHSAILDLRDPQSHRTMYRAMATVVAAEMLADAPGRTLRQTISVARPDTQLSFVRVPAGVEALRVQVDVPYDGLAVFVDSPSREYQQRNSRLQNKRWEGTFEKPEPGVWEIVLRNASDAREFDATRPNPLPPTPVTLTVSLLP